MKHLSEEGSKEIESWAGDDEWLHGGNIWFEELANQLIEKGFTEKEALAILSKAYYTVANEYGE